MGLKLNSDSNLRKILMQSFYFLTESRLFYLILDSSISLIKITGVYRRRPTTYKIIFRGQIIVPYWTTEYLSEKLTMTSRSKYMRRNILLNLRFEITLVECRLLQYPDLYFKQVKSKYTTALKTLEIFPSILYVRKQLTI